RLKINAAMRNPAERANIGAQKNRREIGISKLLHCGLTLARASSARTAVKLLLACRPGLTHWLFLCGHFRASIDWGNERTALTTSNQWLVRERAFDFFGNRLKRFFKNYRMPAHRKTARR